MSKNIIITTIPNVEPIILDKTQRIYDIYIKYPDRFEVHPKGSFPVAASMNNQLLALSDSINVSCQLNLIFPDTVIGADIYRRSLIFLLGMAWNNLYQDSLLEISHSIGHAFYFFVRTVEPDVKQISEIPNDHKEFSFEQYQAIKVEMLKLVSEDIPILSRKPMSNEQAIEIFKAQNQLQTVSLLQSRNETRIMVQQCGNYYQLAHTPLVAKTGLLDKFELTTIDNMMVMTFPSHRNCCEIPKFKHNKPLSGIYEEYATWCQAMKIESIGQLNKINRTERFKSYVQICESRQNEMVAQTCELILRGHKSTDGPIAIADAIKESQRNKRDIIVGNTADQSDQIKLVIISGPSSSGKTTFAKKLQYTLTVMGRCPIVLSMDNYFVNRVDTPKDQSGNYDFEHIEAMDIDLFNDHLSKLLHGEQVQVPTFDFKTGERVQKTEPIILPNRGIIIIEGIHALNPLMTRSVPMNTKFGIFIQPLPSINLDDRTRISTRDYRLFRRIVRDKKYRNCSAERTIELFVNVRKGEDRWIYPHQQRADIFFNSALDYEILVLSTFVTPLLHEISPTSHSYMEARRLLAFLDWVQGVNPDYVPRHSILREFIGSSAFNYD
uniref:Uridine kinase n=1 Tax=Trepomonas sp. PC1 TaxID=1076344 RepID=A0A146KB34_9EUKA|eukprot:JAP94023.1 Uridine kinase [Trepomonas sp. PC1]